MVINNNYKQNEMNKLPLVPYGVGFFYALHTNPKKLNKQLNRRIKYLKEVILISHKNRYKPPKNVVEELNELIAIKKGVLTWQQTQ